MVNVALVNYVSNTVESSVGTTTLQTKRFFFFGSTQWSDAGSLGGFSVFNAQTPVSGINAFVVKVAHETLTSTIRVDNPSINVALVNNVANTFKSSVGTSTSGWLRNRQRRDFQTPIARINTFEIKVTHKTLTVTIGIKNPGVNVALVNNISNTFESSVGTTASRRSWSIRGFWSTQNRRGNVQTPIARIDAFVVKVAYKTSATAVCVYNPTVNVALVNYISNTFESSVGTTATRDSRSGGSRCSQRSR